MIQTTLFIAAGLGIGLLLIQLRAVARHLQTPAPAPPARRPGISILKPLCGVDDSLADNLAAFAALDYGGPCEILLGVEARTDPAWPVACAAAARWPQRFRAVVQRAAPGLNPKVNQLVTLAAEARHEILLVSDSNVVPRPGYLDEIAAHLADRSVGVVTHPIVSTGEARLGAVLDGLHLTCHAAPGMIAAQRVLGLGIVVGKSMAMRADDLRRLGGFAAVKDVLAEDYLLGRMVQDRLGKRIVVGRIPVVQVMVGTSLKSFLARHVRWGVMRKKTQRLPVYLAEIVLNPGALAGAALLLGPSPAAAGAFSAVLVAKVALDAACARRLRACPLGPRALAAAPLKDALAALTWLLALVRGTVVWRGRRLRVGAGTVIAYHRPHVRPAIRLAWRARGHAPRLLHGGPRA